MGSAQVGERYLTALDARSDRVFRDAEFVGPLSHGMRLTGVGQTDVVTAVVVLLLPSGPAAVLWRVVEVVVTTVESVLVAGRVSHVGVERLEGILPTLTHPDATTAVELVLLVGWVVAAVTHLVPDDIHPSSGHAVLSGTTGGFLALETTAGRRVASLQAVGRHFDHFSATAPAPPSRVSVATSGAVGRITTPG